MITKQPATEPFILLSKMCTEVVCLHTQTHKSVVMCCHHCQQFFSNKSQALCSQGNVNNNTQYKGAEMHFVQLKSYYIECIYIYVPVSLDKAVILCRIHRWVLCLWNAIIVPVRGWRGHYLITSVNSLRQTQITSMESALVSCFLSIVNGTMLSFVSGFVGLLVTLSSCPVTLWNKTVYLT